MINTTKTDESFIASEEAVKNAEAYLALLDYNTIYRIDNVLVFYTVKKTKNSVGMDVQEYNYGIFDLRKMEILLNGYCLPNDLRIVTGNKLLEALKREGFMVLSRFKHIASEWNVYQYLTVVDCRSGEIVLDDKRRGFFSIAGRYIITAKALRDCSKYRFSFVDMKERTALPARVDSPTLGNIFSRSIQEDTEKTESSNLKRYYCRIAVSSSTSLKPKYAVPRNWGNKYVYLTPDGIYFDTDILTDDTDAMLVRFSRIRLRHSSDTLENVEDNSYVGLDTAYCWIEPCLRDWFFLDKNGEVFGRYKDNRSEGSPDKANVSRILRSVVDDIKSGRLKEADDSNIEGYKHRAIYDCRNSSQDIYDVLGCCKTVIGGNRLKNFLTTENDETVSV